MAAYFYFPLFLGAFYVTHCDPSNEQMPINLLVVIKDSYDWQILNLRFERYELNYLQTVSYSLF
jgi:hypothetical protein